MGRGRLDRKKLTVMNFSGVYGRQSFFEGREAEWLDCSDVSGTNCYCDPESEREIRRRIGERGPEGIHFLDSGNYHYLSKLWTDLIREPFELVVFDNHTDMQPPMFGDILSCGGWVQAALEENKLLRRVILIGPPERAFEEAEAGSWGLRVAWVSREELLAGESAGRVAESLEGESAGRVAELLAGESAGRGAESLAGESAGRGAELLAGESAGRGAESLAGERAGRGAEREPGDKIREAVRREALPLYLSIDKDVLSCQEAATNWDQGEMTLERLAGIIREAIKGRRVIGWDVCGEDPEHMEEEACAALSDRCNRAILEILERAGAYGLKAARDMEEYTQKNGGMDV